MGRDGRRRFLVAAGALLAASGARAQKQARKKVRIGALTQVDTFRSPLWKPFFAELERRGWRIGETLTRGRLPSITDYAGTVFAKAGCTLAYGPSIVEMNTRLAAFVDRVLRGANPAELPFELPTRFDLVVNAKAVRAIGLSVPQSLLLRADRVIE